MAFHALSPFIRVLAATLTLFFVVGCESPTETVTTYPLADRPVVLENASTAQSLAHKVTPKWVNVAAESGIDFTYFNDAVPDRYFLPEVMGGGIGWFDLDGDELLDVYLMNGAPLDPRDSSPTKHLNQLYRNMGGGQFQSVTHASGAGHAGFGQGCAVADFDADGFPDLYLANYGANALLHNNGDGTFTDLTSVAGVGDDLWGTGAIWLDANDDGFLDLYVANYMDVTLANLKVCRHGGVPGYCGPGDYMAEPDRLYVSQGDGTFVESLEAYGMEAEGGKGLAVIAVDFDDDLKPEIYVANDMAANFLFSRAAQTGDKPAPWRYQERAAAAGCALSDMGLNEASMGIASGDFDGDGRADIFVTHFFNQKNTLYRNLGELIFQDDSRRTRIAATSFHTLGFGTVALDYNRDGALDLFVANGHVLGPNYHPSAMRPQLLRNDGQGRFDDVSNESGPYFEELWLGRGAAGADYDNDGDLDLSVSHLDRPFALLRNDTPTGRHFAGFELMTARRMVPVGGRVVVHVGKRRWVLPVVAGGSYLSSPDPRLLCGLGDEFGPLRVDVHWPSGRVDHWPDLAVDTYWRLREGEPPRRHSSP